MYLDEIIIFLQYILKAHRSYHSSFLQTPRAQLKTEGLSVGIIDVPGGLLGHIVSQEGIKTDPEKTSAIRIWPVPQNIKDVRAFHGFTGYHKRF